MTLWREIFDPAVEDTEAELRHPPVPAGKVRLHVFCGTFDNEEAALAYCYDAPDPVHPEPLTRDLPQATIDTTYVDVAFAGDIQPALTTFFTDDTLSDLRIRMQGSNTLVIVSEYAFGGLPYALSDTPVLRYLGPYLVSEK